MTGPSKFETPPVAMVREGRLPETVAIAVGVTLLPAETVAPTATPSVLSSVAKIEFTGLGDMLSTL